MKQLLFILSVVLFNSCTAQTYELVVDYTNSVECVITIDVPAGHFAVLSGAVDIGDTRTWEVTLVASSSAPSARHRQVFTRANDKKKGSTIVIYEDESPDTVVTVDKKKKGGTIVHYED